MELKVKIARAPLTLEFEAGSLEEAVGIIQDSKDKFIEALDLAVEMGGSPEGSGETPAATAEQPAPTGRGRGRKAKNQPDPTTATAPAPAPVPAAAPTPPLVTTENANGVPAFLDRKNPDAVVNQPPAAAAAPPPPMPPAAAPSVVPAAAPPVSTLAPKIIENLKARAVDDINKNALVEWLAGPGIALVVKGATFDEAMAVIGMTADDKLSGLLAPLGIS